MTGYLSEEGLQRLTGGFTGLSMDGEYGVRKEFGKSSEG